MASISSKLLTSFVLSAFLAQFVICGCSINTSFSRIVHSFRKRDAYTDIAHTFGPNNEAEDHTKLVAPQGSELRSIKIGPQGRCTAAFYQTRVSNVSTILHTIIVIHGKRRNGGEYWSLFNDLVQKAKEDRKLDSNKNVIVVAPQYFSTKYNSGQYKRDQMAWGDLNAWEAGSSATHPHGINYTSIDVLDALVDEFSNRNKYLGVANITIVGHGGGGQLAQRYAMLGAEPPPHVHIRYIHGDPSSCAYFTADRPVSDVGLPTVHDCRLYNDWRYGFFKFPGTLDRTVDPQEFFRRYVTRDVVSVVGYQDVDERHGDQFCMARIQGGRKRRDRNLTWYRYVNMLARTNASLNGFPGTFQNLPDWSHLSQGQIKMRLCIVKDASHSAESVFEGEIGQSALFHDYKVLEGWRPHNSTVHQENNSLLGLR